MIRIPETPLGPWIPEFLFPQGQDEPTCRVEPKKTVLSPPLPVFQSVFSGGSCKCCSVFCAAARIPTSTGTPGMQDSTNEALIETRTKNIERAALLVLLEIGSLGVRREARKPTTTLPWDTCQSATKLSLVRARSCARRLPRCNLPSATESPSLSLCVELKRIAPGPGPSKVLIERLLISVVAPLRRPLVRRYLSGCLPWRRPHCLTFGAYRSSSPTTGCLSWGRWAFCARPACEVELNCYCSRGAAFLFEAWRGAALQSGSLEESEGKSSERTGHTGWRGAARRFLDCCSPLDSSRRVAQAATGTPQ
ncbi:hypothetical protein CPAR01_13765 [Colletotrichum paranaense]|uniref:Uncharacterized protein n=1 Tax=Colletotrichum paranaense TaxID=1914294 RepID=A0ABQ9S4A4_9PEZI|nr:uncharacterized protein CPAR01_13765 [Colletotrichum paranaense]KAK1524817.1 hypothetical protein CPAR01_13765 [Colletotrichum paranaense]